MSTTLQCRIQYLDDTDPFNTIKIAEPQKAPTYTFLTNIPLINQIAGVKRLLRAPHKLEDCTLQLHRTTESGHEYGAYLDLDTPLEEQAEEMEDFADSKKNSLILRTQITVRVHTIIERLLNSSGRELRKSLFSLKQLFQDDKDLVHQFTSSDGLDCLIRIGGEVDRTFQNYIIRAIGQVMLYVDGINSIMKHNETIQWLYSIISIEFSAVSKTAMKLLIVFVEYNESNSILLLQAINSVDGEKGRNPWKNLIDILTERTTDDLELLTFALTLINRTLNAIGEQELYYDVVDSLEEQDMKNIIQQLRQLGDDDLEEQCRIYETVLDHEDSGGKRTEDLSDFENIRQTTRLKLKSSLRKSRRCMEENQQPTKAQRHVLRSTTQKSDSTSTMSSNRRWMLYKINKQKHADSKDDDQAIVGDADDAKDEAAKSSSSDDDGGSSMSQMLSQAKKSLGSKPVKSIEIPSEPKPPPPPPKSEADIQWEQIEQTMKKEKSTD